MIESLRTIAEWMNPQIVVEVVNSDKVALWAAFGGALLGAIVGGAIQFVLSWIAARREKRERQRGLALRAMMRASIIHSDIASTVRAIDESLKLAKERGLTSGATWQKVPPIIGNLPSRDVDIDALAPFVEARESDLVGNTLNSLCGIASLASRWKRTTSFVCVRMKPSQARKKRRAELHSLILRTMNFLK